MITALRLGRGVRLVEPGHVGRLPWTPKVRKSEINGDRPGAHWYSTDDRIFSGAGERSGRVGWHDLFLVPSPHRLAERCLSRLTDCVVVRIVANVFESASAMFDCFCRCFELQLVRTLCVYAATYSRTCVRYSTASKVLVWRLWSLCGISIFRTGVLGLELAYVYLDLHIPAHA